MKPLFVFRVDAADFIGTGHFMRCKTLALALKSHDAEVHFFSRFISPELIRQLTEVSIPFHQLPEVPRPLQFRSSDEWLVVSEQQDATDMAHALQALPRKPDWLIADHYGISAQWESYLRSHVKQIFVIDDLANRKHDCDALLDQNYNRNSKIRYGQLTPPATSFFFGPQFALMREEFANPPKRPTFNSHTPHAFIFFGGADLTHDTLKTLKALATDDLKSLHLTVLCGSLNRDFKEIQTLASERPNWRVLTETNSIAKLMGTADFAIGAGGTTTWERARLGLPSIVIAIAENQITPCQELAEAKAIVYLGPSAQVTEAMIQASARELIQNPQRLAALSQAAQALWPKGERSGAEAIATFLLSSRKT